MRIAAIFATAALFGTTHPPHSAAGDWPQWGRTPTRNMVSPQTGIPATFKAGEPQGDNETIELAGTQNVKWVAKLGSQAYGNPTVANGRIFVGTNNESPRLPKIDGDHGIVYCLNEADGSLLWQLSVPKLGTGKVSDWEYLGICSSPTADGKRVYLVNNRCEIMCLDAEGMANGNDGPFKDEGQYMAGPGEKPLPVGDKDADIIWVFDMREELGVFPHNITSSSLLLVGDRLFATTSNGMDWSHTNIPNPRAPCLVMLDKNTGELLGEENSGISKRLMHANWSSPAYGEVNGKPLVFFGAGDGFCYAFRPETEKNAQGYNILQEVWRFDCNPKEYRFDKSGEPRQYPSFEGPSEIIATPVFHDNRVYVTIGQDPEHGEGLGILNCIDATLQGDISENGRLWASREVERSISTVSIADGLVYVADYTGRVHCMDAKSGEAKWVHDTQSHIWGSTLVVDGKVFIGNESGELTVLAAGPEKKVLSVVQMPAPVYATPVVANGVLYIASQTHLHAIAKD